MLGGTALKPFSSNLMILRAGSHIIFRFRPFITQYSRLPRVRLIHTSPISRWAGSPAQSFRRGWNSFEKFSRSTANEAQNRNDDSHKTSHNTASSESDLQLLRVSHEMFPLHCRYLS